MTTSVRPDAVLALILVTSMLGLPAEAEEPPPVSEATEMCLMCHESLHP